MEKQSFNMSSSEIISEVKRVCIKYGVKHLSLFGSYASGTERPTSDMDFVVYGGKNTEHLRAEIDRIPTLKKIDLFFYDDIRSPELKEDINQYAKKIY